MRSMLKLPCRDILPGFGRRCLLASAAAPLASSLDFLQGTFEKTHPHRLFRQHPLQLLELLEDRRDCMRRSLSYKNAEHADSSRLACLRRSSVLMRNKHAKHSSSL